MFQFSYCVVQSLSRNEKIWPYLHFTMLPYLLPYLMDTVRGHKTKDFITHGTAGPMTYIYVCIFPLLLKSHRGNGHGSRWLLHMEWICVITEEPWGYATPSLIKRATRNLTQPLYQREILSLFAIQTSLKSYSRNTATQDL